MKWQTPVDVSPLPFRLQPTSRLLLVGSCFAGNLGQLFADNLFDVSVNPHGVMYNPVSVLHTVAFCTLPCDVAFLTLGTNRVYRDVKTGEVVDNCCKRPASDFREEALTVAECVDALEAAVAHLHAMNAAVRVVFTVSPIRYAKYGFHGSQLSKATLLLAAEQVAGNHPDTVSYFPAYEIMLDELRDYRYYAADMLHPSAQAVDYLWERLSAACFAEPTRRFLAQWQPLRAAIMHRPFHAEAEAYRQFRQQTTEKLRLFAQTYPHVSRLSAWNQLLQQHQWEL